ncbi:MAG: hypothetical protein EHM40_01300 [Chloroflexi bacterium]|nr:MAG: hypothetical protein EHM40_01300 [Chloroflexota bacterium]
MGIKKALVPILIACTLFTFGCVYVVLPENLGAPSSDEIELKGWSAVVTNIGQSGAGDLHIDLAIRNGTGDWSTMEALDGEPAVLTSDGQSVNCDTVFVGSGGHRLAPGFQMRGYIGGTKYEQETQLLYVECAGAEAAPGARLSIDYSYVTGQYNYYEPDKNRVTDKMEIELDTVAADLTYPVAEPVEGLAQPSGTEIVALNKVVLVLADVQRTETGLQFTWQTTNPGEYPSYVHIGNPPVIGADGIIYGFYETPDIVSVPITPGGGKAEWQTEIPIPQDVTGLYILLSVETGKARLFANYAVDITEK